jgi:hypothetical protein
MQTEQLGNLVINMRQWATAGKFNEIWRLNPYVGVGPNLILKLHVVTTAVLTRRDDPTPINSISAEFRFPKTRAILKCNVLCGG